MERFKIQFTDAQFDDLHSRLDSTRLAPCSQDSYAHGISIELLQTLLEEWRRYDWAPKQDDLNRWDQYLCDFDGQQVHFFHIPSERADAPTVLLCHGWPDSFLRYAKLFGEMQDYNLIIPSLPGFAFSTLPPSGYANNAEVSKVWFRLVHDVLGYRHFFVSGGDMGRGVASYMTADHPEAVLGLHLTDVGLVSDLISRPDQELNEEELTYKRDAQRWLRLEGAYINIQSTKPQTLAFSLADSPAGLAAWWGEKYHAWSDWEYFQLQDLLDALTLTWMTNTGATCIRMYHGNSFDLPPLRPSDIKAPVGIAAFPKDVLPAPQSWIEKNYPVIRFDKMDFGGHFTALENPEGFAQSLTAFIGDVLQ